MTGAPLRADAAAIERIRVDLDDRSYDIDAGVGLIATAGQRIGPLLAQPRVVVVTDETVARLYLDPLRTALAAAGIGHATVILPAGEGTKDFPHLAAWFARIAQRPATERAYALVAKINPPA